MRPRELFILGIRLLGVWFLTLAFQYVIAAIAVWRTVEHESANRSIEAYGINGAGFLLISVYLLLGAPQIVGMTYGHRVARAADAPDADAPKNSG